MSNAFFDKYLEYQKSKPSLAEIAYAISAVEFGIYNARLEIVDDIQRADILFSAIQTHFHELCDELAKFFLGKEILGEIEASKCQFEQHTKNRTT